ncbi:MAG TPA: carbonic anhydrase [Dehalococcoidia bacterium]|nr:carbonic anhydrase [Dehalococcoidia bacterium]
MAVNRRDLLRLGTGTVLGAGLFGGWIGSSARAADTSGGQPTAEQALQALLDGNKRFVAGQPMYPDQSLPRRQQIASGQMPPVAVLCCIDSRVPPELVFDQGLGTLFVARVAGNIVDDALLGSIEYGIVHYQIPLLVVLGHQSCGAVIATVDALTMGTEAEGHIGVLADAIMPPAVLAQSQPGDLVDNTVRANIKQSAAQLRSSEPILAEEIHAGHLKVAGIYYSLDTGAVEVIDPM